MLLTGAQIIIETLIELGVKDVFGYPGAAVLDIYDELYKNRDRINHYLTAHEQGASHAADGYARVSGKVGVVIATSGPGATNLVTGIATAMLDSIPLVAITGNVSTSNIGKDSFQEVNITGITMPITKHNYFVSSISELQNTIKEAFEIAESGRPGPVLIDIPKDVQQAKYEYFSGRFNAVPHKAKTVDSDLFDKAVSLIKNAERPYILIGGGVISSGISSKIVEFAEKIDAYIGCTLMGISAIPYSCDRFLGMDGMHGRYASTMADKSADLIIGIGVRFSDRTTGNADEYIKRAKIIQIDVDRSEINKNIKVDLGIIGELNAVFSCLCDKINSCSHKKWHEIVDEYKKCEKEKEIDYDNYFSDKLTAKSILNQINLIKNDDTVIVTDVGQHQMWTAQYIKLEKERKFCTSGGLGTMGYGLGAAIGACISSGHKSILITGDGSFGMNLNELCTVATYNIPIVIIVINNGVLGMVRQWQHTFCDNRYSSTDLNRKTDFVKVAEAFGIKGANVSDEHEFRNVFSSVYSLNQPFLIDCKIDKDEYVMPLFTGNNSSENFSFNAGEDKE